jgi:hypothetical protein
VNSHAKAPSAGSNSGREVVPSHRARANLLSLPLLLAVFLLAPASAAAANGSLDVTIEGSGSGEVASLGEGIFETTPPIACDYESPGPATGVCNAELANEEGVFGAWVKAIPDPGSEFTGWVVEGAINQFFCEEPEAQQCLVNNEAEEETEIKITATFAAAAGPNGSLDVTIEGSGSGEVASLGEGIFETTPPIACDYESPGPATGICNAELANEEGTFGAWVKAIPDPGSEFTGWVVEGAINQIFCEEPEAQQCLINNEAEEETEIKITATFAAAVAAPTVNGVSPEEGPTAGGNEVTVTGTDLQGATFKFGANPASGVVINPAGTSATMNAPAGAAGTVNVIATTAGGESPDTAADDYTYVAAPTLTDVNPEKGPTAGGNSVTVTGTNLQEATFEFGANPASGVVINPAGTSATMNAPAGAAGTVNVIATTAGGESANTAADDYTYTLPPTVTSIVPDEGSTAGGTAVTITGTDLTGATEVKYGSTAVTCTGVVATCKVESPTEIKATTPAHVAGTVDVRAVTPGGESAVNAPGDQFTFIAPPAVTAVTPAKGPTTGGNQVEITGLRLTAASKVEFGTTVVDDSEFTENTDTTIRVNAPAHVAGTVDVRVTTIGGTSGNFAQDNYTYEVPVPVPPTPAGGGSGSGSSTANDSPPPNQPPCVVPKLKGMSLAAAKSALAKAHCKTGKVTKPKAKKGKKLGPLVVKSSTPGAGATLPANSKVNLKLGARTRRR